jgi:hypothetical protein
LPKLVGGNPYEARVTKQPTIRPRYAPSPTPAAPSKTPTSPTWRSSAYGRAKTVFRSLCLGMPRSWSASDNGVASNPGENALSRGERPATPKLVVMSARCVVPARHRLSRASCRSGTVKPAAVRQEAAALSVDRVARVEGTCAVGE